MNNVGALYCVNLAKMELCFQEFCSLCNSRLLATGEVSVKFERQKGNSSHVQPWQVSVGLGTVKLRLHSFA